MEDILVQLIPGFLGVLTGIAAWLKCHAEVNQVKKDREERSSSSTPTTSTRVLEILEREKV